jgi:HAD superfamily hydrolase (TIGR01549 family)
MIKAVIFDCFGVLYIPKSDYVYQSLLANPAVHHDEIRDLVAQDEYGLIDDQTLFEGIAKLTNTPLDKVKRSLVDGFVRNHELIEYTQQIRGRVKVAMLSNLGRESVVKFFTAEERAKLFDAAVISGEVGMIKPHPEIYEYACHELGVDTSEAVFVDDVETNCEGAREAGLQAIRYESLMQITQALDQLLEVQ